MSVIDMPLMVGALFSGSSMTMEFLEEEEVFVAFEDDEGGLTVFSQPSVKQNTGLSYISGYGTSEPGTVTVSCFVVVSLLPTTIVEEDKFFGCEPVAADDNPGAVEVEDAEISATGTDDTGLGASSLQQVRTRADVPKRIKEKMCFIMIYQI